MSRCACIFEFCFREKDAYSLSINSSLHSDSCSFNKTETMQFFSHIHWSMRKEVRRSNKCSAIAWGHKHKRFSFGTNFHFSYKKKSAKDIAFLFKLFHHTYLFFKHNFHASVVKLKVSINTINGNLPNNEHVIFNGYYFYW